MKNLIALLLTITFFISIGQPVNRSFERADGAVNLLGEATLDRLRDAPFQEWFNESYSGYEADVRLLENTYLPDSITIFMGTWCGDSQREVPRFVKILEQTSFDMKKLKIICLNTGFQNYKQAPEREERGANIHRVPTFILHDSETNEIGRIVEEPVVSLEQDFDDIMTGKMYETAYPVVNDLIKKFENYSVSELRKMLPTLVKEYKGKAASEYELNTYGYVLWTSFELMKAELVFELNSRIYSDSTVPFGTLASFKETLGKRKEATTSLKKGLSVDPDNEYLNRIKRDLQQ